MDHYEVLGISRNATEEDIQDAFENSGDLLQPDDDSISIRRIQKAYDVLIDPASREQYEREIFRGDIVEQFETPVFRRQPPFWKRWDRSHLWWIMIIWLVLLPILAILVKAIWYVCDIVKSLYI